MLKIYKIPVSTPYPVGPVNSYLLPEEPCTLIDPGPNTAEGKKALEQGIKAAGVSLGDIKKLIITHFHPDHSGLAGWVRELSSAQIFLHKNEVPKLIGKTDFIKERFKFLIEAGLSEKIILEIKGDGERQPPRPLLSEGALISLSGEEKLFAGGRVWQVLFLPGHSTGHICVFEPGEGNFISGDFLLERITPNPILEVDPDHPGRRAKSLQWYLEGLERVEKLPIKITWPGHGREFSNYRQVIEEGRRHHEVRCREILGIIQQENYITALQIMNKMYPGLKGFEIFMGISEILGHLDYMLDQERVKTTQRGNVLYYYL